MDRNRDGSYAVKFDDGDEDLKVPAGNVRYVGATSPHSSSPRASDISTSSFRIGDRVEARYRGGYSHFEGKITAVNRDGTYDVMYDDEYKGEERDVKADWIKSLSISSSPRRDNDDRDRITKSYMRGDEVEAKFKGGRKI